MTLLQIDPQFYAFRWITCMLTQEYAFPDVLRVWDSILSDSRGRLDCMLRICVSMLLAVKPKLMAGDFATCVKLLQRYPASDVNVLLEMAATLPTCCTA